MSNVRVKLSLAAFVAVVTLLGVMANGTSTAMAAIEIHVGDRNNNSLTDVQDECLDAGGAITSWTFVINQIRSGAKPAITVDFATGPDVVVNAGPQGGSSNAHYTVAGSGEVLDAYADIHDGWRGQFVLSHVTCEEGPETPPLDACTPFPNRIIITFDDFLLRRDQASGVQTPSEAVSIDPGTYRVTLQSYDDHVGHPGQNQLEEQWFLRFALEGGGTVESGTISDLPEEPVTLLNEYVGEITFASEATGVVAVHKLPYLQGAVAQSVVPKCAALDPVLD